MSFHHPVNLSEKSAQRTRHRDYYRGLSEEEKQVRGKRSYAWKADRNKALKENLEITGTGKDREERTNLGLAIAHALCEPGQVRSREELAAFCDVTMDAIAIVERRAIRKMKEHPDFQAIAAELGFSSPRKLLGEQK